MSGSSKSGLVAMCEAVSFMGKKKLDDPSEKKMEREREEGIRWEKGAWYVH